jgi:hypothetical protein
VFRCSHRDRVSSYSSPYSSPYSSDLASPSDPIRLASAYIRAMDSDVTRAF